MMLAGGSFIGLEFRCGSRCRRGLFRGAQGLVNVRLDVFHVLKADGEADVILRDAGLLLLGRRQLRCVVEAG